MSGRERGNGDSGHVLLPVHVPHAPHCGCTKCLCRRRSPPSPPANPPPLAPATPPTSPAPPTSPVPPTLPASPAKRKGPSESALFARISKERKRAKLHGAQCIIPDASPSLIAELPAAPLGRVAEIVGVLAERAGHGNDEALGVATALAALLSQLETMRNADLVAVSRAVVGVLTRATVLPPDTLDTCFELCNRVLDNDALQDDAQALLVRCRVFSALVPFLLPDSLQHLAMATRTRAHKLLVRVYCVDPVEESPELFPVTAIVQAMGQFMTLFKQQPEATPCPGANKKGRRKAAQQAQPDNEESVQRKEATNSWQSLMLSMNLRLRLKYEQLSPSHKARVSKARSVRLRRTYLHESLTPPSQWFVDLGTDPSNSDLLLALAQNKVVRFHLRDMEWATVLSHLRVPDVPSRCSTLLPCPDGFTREYFLEPGVVVEARTRFYMRDVPTPQHHRDEVMRALPLVARQDALMDFHRFVPFMERGDNHDMYFGEGKFAAGMHVDEGRLMGINGCVRGFNSWFFVHPDKTDEFETAARDLLVDCGPVWLKHQPLIMSDEQFITLLHLNPPLQGFVFKVSQTRGQFLMFPSGWAHQVVAEGPPTLKIAWALMPYTSLGDSLRALDEYRQQQRILVDNAGRAILLGGIEHANMWKQAHGKLHLMTVRELVTCFESLQSKFNPQHASLFKFRPGVELDSPYCHDCKTPVFYWFSSERDETLRCYECTTTKMKDGQLDAQMISEVDQSLSDTLAVLREAQDRGAALWAQRSHARGTASPDEDNNSNELMQHLFWFERHGKAARACTMPSEHEQC